MKQSEDPVALLKWVTKKHLEAQLTALEALGVGDDAWATRLRDGIARLRAEVSSAGGMEPA